MRAGTAPESDPGLPRHLHRRLAARLALAALATTVLLSAAAVFLLRDLVRNEAVADARTRAGLLESVLVNGAAKPADIGQLLRALTADTGTDTGRFVFLRVVDSAGHVTAGVSADHHGSLAKLLAQTRPPGPGLGGQPVFDWHMVGHRPFLEVIIPLRAPQGAPQLVLQGWYAISREEERAAAATIALAAAGTGGAVGLTALILYPAILGLMRRVGRMSDELLESHLEILRALGGAIAERDSDTDLHNFRVTIYAARLAAAAGLDDNALRSLIKGALLHDVGKIGVRDRILLKPGRLDRDEFEQMKLHVPNGLAIVGRSRWLADAVPVVGSHHEKMDGTGYPAGLQGPEIPLAARIFALADVFDALTSRRPYKEPLGCDEAVAIMREDRGTHFDPRLFDLFAGMARELFDTYARDETGRARADVGTLINRCFGTTLAPDGDAQLPVPTRSATLR